MKIFFHFILLLVLSISFVSCFKKETPYPVPPKEKFDTSVYESTVSLGSTYNNQVYYSLTNGVIKTNEYNIWDIAFSMNDTNEIWMNNGKNVLLYATNFTQFNEITAASGLDAKKWLYDDNSGTVGNSGIGILDNQHLNKIFIAKIATNTYYKFIIKSISNQSYVIEVAALNENTGKEITITKDNKYNLAYLNFEQGIVEVEPQKTEWDILFTRYRYIYKKYNDDGSDFLYLVTGVLTNPYNTESAGDSVVLRDFKTFNTDSLGVMNVNKNLDNIGFNWKKADIQTGNYKVNDRMIYVIKDQTGTFWKFHFYSFVNNLGEKGNPSFRYTRL